MRSRPVVLAGQLRRLVYDLRTEGSGAARESASIGLGAFVGCSPFYGFHLLLCWGLGRLLRLNRLKMYLAANVSNPLLAPFIVLLELQAGAWIRRGAFHPFTLESVRTTNPWTFGADLIVGSIVVGGILAGALAAATYAVSRSGDDDDRVFAEVARRAADRYVATSITAWEFARGKLRADPVYRTVVGGSVLPSGGTLLDVGCGRGLTLAVLAEAASVRASGGWPPERPAPPAFNRLIGIELRPRVAAIARQALEGAATIVGADIRDGVSERCRAVLLFDVLQMMPAPDQLKVLQAVTEALEPGGAMLVREADADAGWRFQVVRIGNRLKALALGRWKQPFHFRGAAEWQALFRRFGFDVERHPGGTGAPFANLLFVLTPPGRRT